MQIGVMTSTRVDRPLDIYSIFQGERSAGRVSDKPPWRSHQQRRNTWRSHKPQKMQYSYEAYWLSLITLRNAPQPYSRTTNQQSLSPRILYNGLSKVCIHPKLTVTDCPKLNDHNFLTM